MANDGRNRNLFWQAVDGVKAALSYSWKDVLYSKSRQSADSILNA